MASTQSTHHLGRLFAVLLAGSLLALGACGSSSSKSTGTNAPSGTNAPNSPANPTSSTKTGAPNSSAPSGSSTGKVCDQFTVGDAAQLFGEAAVAQANPPADPLGGDGCVYLNKNRTSTSAYWSFDVHHYTQPAVFDATHAVHKNYTNLSGIGDAAFAAPDVIGSGWQIEVKKGNDVYTFDLNASNFGGAKPNVSQSALVALVRSKLG